MASWRLPGAFGATSGSPVGRQGCPEARKERKSDFDNPPLGTPFWHIFGTLSHFEALFGALFSGSLFELGLGLIFEWFLE